MGKTTGIEWCDSTLNLQMGCDGCELWNEKRKRCYAGVLIERWGDAIKGTRRFTEPQLFPERLEEALRWPDLTGQDRPLKPWLNGYPRLVFLNDMGDTFTESLPLLWLMKHIPALAASPHIYIVLTKRPARMREFWHNWCYGECSIDHFTMDASELAKSVRPIPPNFWLLTSVTSQANAGRISDLLQLRDYDPSVLGVSYEPAWGPVDLRAPELDWVIAGGESGRGAFPADPQWIRAARDACHRTPFFFKQWGEYAEDGELVAIEGQLTYPVRRLVGKKRAGRLLDGRECNGMPALRAAYTDGKWFHSEKILDTNRTPGDCK